MQISRNFLLFAVSIASISQRCSSHDCSTPLRNKVAYEGASASFEREYNAEIGLWTLLQYSPNSWPFPLPAEKLANDDGSVAEKFVGTYAVNQSQLTVLNSTVVPPGSMPYPTAGLYQYMYEDTDCLTAACLVVVRSSNTSTVATLASNCSGENLKNTVVYEGVATTLKRSYTGQWQVIPSSMSFSTLKNITDTNGHMNAEFCSTYSVSRSNLTILNSTLAPQGSMPYSTAGLYILRYPNPNCTIAANVIVIRSGPVCACNATNPNNVTLSCSVFYAEASVQPSNPIFTWNKNNGVKVKEQQPIPKMIERYIRKSMSQLSISSNDATTYECQMTFSAPSKSPFNFINLNAPDFKASCSVSCV